MIASLPHSQSEVAQRSLWVFPTWTLFWCNVHLLTCLFRVTEATGATQPTAMFGLRQCSVKTSHRTLLLWCDSSLPFANDPRKDAPGYRECTLATFFAPSRILLFMVCGQKSPCKPALLPELLHSCYFWNFEQFCRWDQTPLPIGLSWMVLCIPPTGTRRLNASPNKRRYTDCMPLSDRAIQKVQSCVSLMGILSF